MRRERRPTERAADDDESTILAQQYSHVEEGRWVNQVVDRVIQFRKDYNTINESNAIEGTIRHFFDSHFPDIIVTPLASGSTPTLLEVKSTMKTIEVGLLLNWFCQVQVYLMLMPEMHDTAYLVVKTFVVGKPFWKVKDARPFRVWTVKRMPAFVELVCQWSMGKRSHAPSWRVSRCLYCAMFRAQCSQSTVPCTTPARTRSAKRTFYGIKKLNELEM